MGSQGEGFYCISFSLRNTPNTYSVQIISYFDPLPSKLSRGILKNPRA